MTIAAPHCRNSMFCWIVYLNSLYTSHWSGLPTYSNNSPNQNVFNFYIFQLIWRDAVKWSEALPVIVSPPFTLSVTFYLVFSADWGRPEWYQVPLVIRLDPVLETISGGVVRTITWRQVDSGAWPQEWGYGHVSLKQRSIGSETKQ